jgi:hypothetical protein
VLISDNEYTIDMTPTILHALVSAYIYRRKWMLMLETQLNSKQAAGLNITLGGHFVRPITRIYQIKMARCLTRVTNLVNSI